jgi:hypothetical protein
METLILNKNSSIVNLSMAADITVGNEVKISAAKTIAAAGSGDFSIGVLESKPDSFPGNGAVRVKYNEHGIVTFGGTVTAGDRLKLGTPGTGGNQRYVKFTPGTDEAGLERGITLEDGTADSTGEILRF